MSLIVSVGVALMPAGVMGAVGGTVAATGIAGALGGTTAATLGGTLLAGTLGAGVLGGAAYGVSEMVSGAENADKAAAQNKAAQQKYIADTSSVPAAVTDATGVSTGDLAPIGDIGQSAATGGLLALKKGGHVPLKDGAYIIPADVVSALGNGSSKAGAEFLRRLLVEVRNESVKRQGLGAVSNKNAA